MQQGTMAPWEKERKTISRKLNTSNSRKDCDESSSNARKSRILRFAMICCEEKEPYGPALETANNFLDLLCMAYERYISSSESLNAIGIGDTAISLTVYHAQYLDYPSNKSEWDSFDGVIIPGSLSAAYDDHVEWIKRLQTTIREEIHLNRRKTLGVCFGHQSFAHAFKNTKCDVDGHEKYETAVKEAENPKYGMAVECPSGIKVGIQPCTMTSAGKCFLSHRFCHPGLEASCLDIKNKRKENLQMLYTHGDMVLSLPPNALSLGGNSDVPIEASAYFESEEAASKFLHHSRSLESKEYDVTTLREKLRDLNECGGPSLLPYAFTFQAHPEYVAPNGFKVNFMNIMTTFAKRGSVTENTSQSVCLSATKNFDDILADSLDAMIAVAVLLGWF